MKICKTDYTCVRAKAHKTVHYMTTEAYNVVCYIRVDVRRSFGFLLVGLRFLWVPRTETLLHNVKYKC